MKRVWRQTVLALIASALATVILVFAFTIQSGTPGQVSAAYRALFGDILILPTYLAVPEAGLGQPGEWRFYELSLDRPGPYTAFVPYAAIGPWLERPASVAFSEVPRVLTRFRDVESVEPYATLPALLEAGDGAEVPVDLRAWPNGGTCVLQPFVTSGRCLDALDTGRGVAMVDGTRIQRSSQADHYYGYDRFNGDWIFWRGDRPYMVAGSSPAPGDTLRLAMPTWNHGVPDYSSLQRVQLSVVGTFQLADGVWPYTSHSLTGEGLELTGRPKPPVGKPVPYLDEPRVLTTPSILVPSSTFTAIAAQVGLPDPVPQAYIVRLRTTQNVYALTQQLQTLLPQFTVLSVAALAQDHPLAMVPTLATPHEDLQQVLNAAQVDFAPPRLPTWVSRTIIALAFGMAASLFFANFIVNTFTRIKEFATLRVLGASTFQLYMLIGIEIFIIAFIGGMLGLTLSSPVALYQLVSTAGLRPALVRLGTQVILVTVLAVGASVLFGGALGSWIVRRSPWSVLKSE